MGPSTAVDNESTDSLNRRFLLGGALGLLASALLLAILFIGLYQSELAKERAQAASQVNALLQSSLENAMLKRDLEGLRTIVERLGQQPGVAGVMIVNAAGQIRFSSDPSLLFQPLPHRLPTEANQESSAFVTDHRGREVLRSVNPVQNREPCFQCHGASDRHPINGVLLVDFDAGSIRAGARDTTLLLLGLGALLVTLNLAGAWWFFRRFVIRPIQRLAGASQQLSEGDLDARVEVQGGDEIARLGRTFNHMADALRTQMAALESHGRFLQSLLDAIPDGVRILSLEGRILYVNRAYEGMLGHAPGTQAGRSCYASSQGRETPCPATLVNCPLAGSDGPHEPFKFIHRMQRADGRTLDVEVSAAYLQALPGQGEAWVVVESMRDLEAQVRFSHEQKLSELGRLATGVAHEIYNPLSSVKLALDAVDRVLPPESEQARSFLGLVDQEVAKCKAITERLLKLSLPPSTRPELVNARETVEQTLSLLRWEADEYRVQVQEEYPAEELRVLGSDSELRMIALNLAQNAFHAMPNGGVLQVSLRRVGDRVELVFSDTGVGINPEHREQIFLPFFSRRADGRHGTGLGLSILRSMLHQRGGEIRVESEVGRGSRFIVHLPAALPEGEPA